jgi:hypothetical protein
MAQWQYAMLCTELTVALTLMTNCETLQDYGMKGWELAQVLQPRSDAWPFGL